MKWQQHIELDGYINLWEVIPEDKHSKLANVIWEALDDEGITLTQDAELSIRVYDSYDSVTHFDQQHEKYVILIIYKSIKHHGQISKENHQSNQPQRKLQFKKQHYDA